MFELTPPAPHLNLNVVTDWTKTDVEVLNRDYDKNNQYRYIPPAWITADKDDSPNVVSTIADQLENGIGSGNCRLKVGPSKAIVACRWHF